jgi:UDP-4-amino-4,6-dideoxy-N-acetyl-beta-L-altrosamine N-acetyltransferase
MLIGKRIKLCAIEESDLEKMVSWRNNYDLYKVFFEFEPLSMATQRKWFEKYLTNPNEKLFIISTLEGCPIGMVGLANIDLRNRKAEWGRILIGEKKYTKNNYGSEALLLIMEYAFEHLNLNKLYCYTLESNEKATSLYKVMGFKREGILRKHIYKQGDYHNLILFSILKKEYWNTKKSFDSLRKKFIKSKKTG